MRTNSFTRQPIYGTFSLVMLGVIVVTLLPHYAELLGAGQPPRPSLVTHGVLYLGWYVLFCVQARLVAKGNVALHRTLGYFSLGLFALLLFSGLHMLYDVIAAIDLDGDPATHRISFAWSILHSLLFFAGFYLLGIGYRKRPHAHKRFMLLASLTMIPASVTRVAYLPGIPIDGTAFTLLTSYAFLVAPLVIDRLRFGRVHPVLKWFVLIFIITQLLFIAVIPNSAIGPLIAFM